MKRKTRKEKEELLEKAIGKAEKVFLSDSKMHDMLLEMREMVNKQSEKSDELLKTFLQADKLKKAKKKIWSPKIEHLLSILSNLPASKLRKTQPEPVQQIDKTEIYKKIAECENLLAQLRLEEHLIKSGTGKYEDKVLRLRSQRFLRELPVEIYRLKKQLSELESPQEEQSE